VVRRLTGGGVTVLLTTQYLEEADQLVVIDRGRIAASGTPDQLKAQVGRQVLQVSPVSPADVGVVTRVVTDLAGAAPDSTGGVVSAQVGDPGLPPAILQRLTDAGVPVAELTLRKPSLDEVFFALTGHRAGVADAGDHDDDRSAA
jgi:oleandomycin transport system ATP-binding protein